MKLAERLGLGESSRSSSVPMTLENLSKLLSGNGGMGRYLGAPNTTLGGDPAEPIDPNFEGMVQRAFAENGIVFACILARQLLFSEARFQYRRYTNGVAGDLFGHTSLATLESPSPSVSLRKMLARMEQDSSLAGNAFHALRPDGNVRRLRPDWVTIVMASETGSEIDREVIGYAYKHGGGGRPEIILPENMSHYAPVPDPLATFRGMSWLTPIIRTIEADEAAETHKQKFFENGATANMVVTLDKDINPGAFDEWVDAFDEAHTGLLNAYKTLYFGGGADVKVVGADMKQIDFKVVQGAGETRIAAAAGVPPIIVGLSEGLEAATYSNYGQARRRFADGTMYPLWGAAADALQPILRNVPEGAHLWYDVRGISFLQEDEKDAADIFFVDAQSARQLVDGGYDADSVIASLAARDPRLLKHTGRVSVQLLAPGTEPAPVKTADK